VQVLLNHKLHFFYASRASANDKKFFHDQLTNKFPGCFFKMKDFLLLRANNTPISFLNMKYRERKKPNNFMVEDNTILNAKPEENRVVENC